MINSQFNFLAKGIMHEYGSHYLLFEALYKAKPFTYRSFIP